MRGAWYEGLEIVRLWAGTNSLFTTETSRPIELKALDPALLQKGRISSFCSQMLKAKSRVRWFVFHVSFPQSRRILSSQAGVRNEIRAAPMFSATNEGFYHTVDKKVHEGSIFLDGRSSFGSIFRMAAIPWQFNRPGLVMPPMAVHASTFLPVLRPAPRPPRPRATTTEPRAAGAIGELRREQPVWTGLDGCHRPPKQDE